MVPHLSADPTNPRRSFIQHGQTCCAESTLRVHRGGEGRRGADSAGPAGSAEGAVWPAGRAREAEVRCGTAGPSGTLGACVCVTGRQQPFP